MTEALRVGIVGFGWMGQVHARAYARLRHHYLDSTAANLSWWRSPTTPRMTGWTMQWRPLASPRSTTTGMS